MLLSKINKRIGLGTRVIHRTTALALFRYDNNSWLLWLHIEDYGAAYTQWRGTYLRLYDDGSVQRITINPDDSEDTSWIT